MPIQAIIFDCDGVLFDSWGANIAYYNAVLAVLGRPPLDAAGEQLAHTLSSPQLYTALFGDDTAAVARAQAAARSVDYGPFYLKMRPVPRLHHVLADLKRQYRLAMATNRGSTVGGVVRHFGLESLLEIAVGIFDVPRPKPFPDMIDKCLDHLAVPPERALYVGDSRSDLEAAHAAGTHFIAVGDVPGATRRIGEIGELVAVLREW